MLLDNKNRSVLAQTFIIVNSEEFTVAVNCFKSKVSDCNSLEAINVNDGYGRCSSTRADVATALVSCLATGSTTSSDDDSLILGDLDAYTMEDLITNITAVGYNNLLDASGRATA